MARIELTGEDHRNADEMLRSAYGIPDLRNVLRREFGSVHDRIGWSKSVAEVVPEVIHVANELGVLDRVLVALVAERPHRPDLLRLQLALSVRPGWGVASGPYGLDAPEAVTGLERLLGEGNPFVAAEALTGLLVTVPNQVCHIKEVDSAGRFISGGTGFLIGPDLVLTNHHVVEKHLNDGATVQVRFGYHSLDVAGDWLDLDPGWDIPSSPPGAADSIPPFGQPTLDELDYAVLKLATRPGDDVLVAGPRGWIDLSGEPGSPTLGEPAFIIGHPGNDDPPPRQHPLSVSFEARAFEAINDNGTRVAYRVDTKRGSSGSPVFDGQMQPVVLHHNRGDSYDGPDQRQAATWSRNNRGIPLRTVWRDFPERVKARLEPSGRLVPPPGGGREERSLEADVRPGPDDEPQVRLLVDALENHREEHSGTEVVFGKVELEDGTVAFGEGVNVALTIENLRTAATAAAGLCVVVEVFDAYPIEEFAYSQVSVPSTHLEIPATETIEPLELGTGERSGDRLRIPPGRIFLGSAGAVEAYHKLEFAVVARQAGRWQFRIEQCPSPSSAEEPSPVATQSITVVKR